MSDAVKIRMYNVGFGDSFLLTIPAPDRPRKVLIDCGTHSAGPGPRPTAEVVRQIVEDVTEDGVPRIDVVVATHRHRDHVVGFQQKIWETVQVREVWMPWTENYSDPEARKLLEEQSTSALSLFLALRRLNVSPEALALVKNSLKNARAMATLHDGFAPSPKPRRRYLPSSVPKKQTFTTTVLPGVRVHVMGPSRKEDVIREMIPPPGEFFLSLAAKGAGAAKAPFRQKWWIKPAELRDDPKRSHLASPSLAAKINRLAKGDILAAAVSLDNAVNGTSLVLMLEIGRAFLLFSGDAQWGTWKAALDDPRWPPLLARTTFYKVGHHGSTNATPTSLVNILPAGDLWCMVSTRKTNIESWDDIPRPPLLDKLLEKERHRLVRSDIVTETDHADFVRTGDRHTDVSIPV